MTALQNLTSFFDITVRDQLEATFKSVTSDKIFLFSGPPKYSLLSTEDRSLCPLLFTTNVNVDEGRMPGPKIGGLGTDTTIDMPSSQNSQAIRIGSYAVITDTPRKVTGVDGDLIGGEVELVAAEKDKWNILKRVYYDAIKFSDGALLKYFLPEAGVDRKKSSLGFNVVAKTKEDIFSNFGKSEFYEIPFGILAISLTKSHSSVLVRYFEGCKLMSPGSLLSSSVGAPAYIHSGLSMSFKDEVPLDSADIDPTWMAGTDYEDFTNTLYSYIGEEST